MSAPEIPDIAGLREALLIIGDAVAAQRGARDAVRLLIEAACLTAERSGEMKPTDLMSVFLEVAEEQAFRDGGGSA